MNIKFVRHCDEQLGEALGSRKWLRFKHFITMAVKEGSSERSHLDLQDWKDWLTLVISIGVKIYRRDKCIPQSFCKKMNN